MCTLAQRVTARRRTADAAFTHRRHGHRAGDRRACPSPAVGEAGPCAARRQRALDTALVVAEAAAGVVDTLIDSILARAGRTRRRRHGPRDQPVAVSTNGTTPKDRDQTPGSGGTRTPYPWTQPRACGTECRSSVVGSTGGRAVVHCVMGRGHQPCSETTSAGYAHRHLITPFVCANQEIRTSDRQLLGSGAVAVRRGHWIVRGRRTGEVGCVR